jgi:hypothetical protein
MSDIDMVRGRLAAAATRKLRRERGFNPRRELICSDGFAVVIGVAAIVALALAGLWRLGVL